MGICGSKPKSPEAAQDKLIGQRLKEYSAKESKILKILLLGTGDSGKTTIFKQMKILYGDGVPEDELEAARRPIFQELIKGSQAVINACGTLKGSEPLSAEESLNAAQTLLDISADDIRELGEAAAEAITILWNDPIFQKTWDLRSNIQVIDGFSFFAKKCADFPKWGGSDWIPSVEDYLNSRSRTTGSITEKFVIDNTPIQLVDVGGQRNERRKWIFVFEGVTAVLFVAAISEYDQTLFEEEKKNRLEEAFGLFDKMVNSEWFKNTNMILFLNKADLFEEKLCKRKIPLNKSGLFPSAPKGFNKDEAVDWLKREFLKRCRNDKSLIFPHLTTATDTNNMKYVLDACKFILLKEAVDGILF